MLEDLLAERAGVEEAIDALTPREMMTPEAAKLVQRHEELCRALGDDEVAADPLVAKWDRELEAGRTPDLDEE